jgi:hypothetical protein
MQALPVQSEDGSTFHAARESKPCAKAQLYQAVLAVVVWAATAYVDWLLFLASGITAGGLSFLQQTFQKGESSLRTTHSPVLWISREDGQLGSDVLKFPLLGTPGRGLG